MPSQTHTDGSRNTLIALCTVTLLTSASMFLFIPECGTLFFDRTSGAFLDPIVSDHERRWLYAAALTVPQVGAAISAPLWGLCTDRWGAKYSLVGAVAGSAVAMVSAALAVIQRAPGGLIAALASAGLMEGSFVISQAAVLEASPPQEKEGHIGLLGACSTLGLVGGPLLAGLSWWSAGASGLSPYAVPFVIAASLLVVAGLFASVAYRQRQAARRVAAVPAPSILRSFIPLLEQRRVRNAAGLFFLMELALACYYERLPLLLQTSGTSPLVIALFAAYIAALIAATCVLLLPLLQRHLTERSLIAVAFAVLATAGVLLVGQPTPARAWLSGVPFGLGAGAIYCVVMARLSDWSGPDSQGKISGIASAVGGSAFLAAGLIIGSSDFLGDVAAGIIALVGTAGVYLVRLPAYGFLHGDHAHLTPENT